VREEGHPVVVYVRCGNCGDLVARYVLRDYYHHGKGVESYLRSHGSSSSESGRAELDTFHKVKQDALEGYLRAVDWLKERGKDPDA